MEVANPKSIEIKNVSRLFGSMVALKKFSLSLNSGEVVALVGPNGAGKSTLLSILSTMQKPSIGEILVDGKAVKPQMLRSKIGFLSHKPFVYPELTAKENLQFFANLYSVNSTKVDEIKDTLSLDTFFDNRPAGVLSKGQLQKLSLARVLLANPSILLLDEPASGLDSRSIEQIEAVVKKHSEQDGITVVVSHDPGFVSRIATRVVSIDKGKLVDEIVAPFNSDQVAKLCFGKPGGGEK